MKQFQGEIEEQTKPKRFRLAARKAFLTYSQMPLEVTKEELLQQLQSKVSFAHYVIGRELHQDGGAHFHVVLISEKKFDIRNANMLDLQLNGTKFHGNYGATRHLNASIEYACKDGDYITDLEYIVKGKVISLELLLAEKFKASGRDQTLQDHFLENTKKAFGKVDLVSVDKLFNLIQQIDSRRPKSIKSNYKIEDFKVDDRLNSWIKAKEKPTLFLVGPSGAGKTQFIIALAEQLNWKMLHINELQGLNRLSPEHNAIFFDDFTFSKIHEDQLLALTDNEYQKDIRILYKSVSKEPGLAQIFAMNRSALSRIKDLISQEQFSRRIELIDIPKDFIQVNLNIQINNININLNESGSQGQTPKSLSRAQAKTELEQARMRANNQALRRLRLSPAEGSESYIC